MNFEDFLHFINGESGHACTSCINSINKLLLGATILR